MRIRLTDPELVIELPDLPRRAGRIAAQVAPDMLHVAGPDAPNSEQGRSEIHAYLNTCTGAHRIEAESSTTIRPSAPNPY